MANTLISLLTEKGYSNTGDNRNYTIKSINTMLDSGFVELHFLSYERQKTHGYFYDAKNGKRNRTIYKVTVFGNTYFGHFMPTRVRHRIGNGFPDTFSEINYSEIDLYSVLCRIARLINLNKSGFDFLKEGNCNCVKCKGTGFIPQFAHYAEGVCFDCGGTGINNRTLKSYIKQNVEKATLNKQ